MDFIFLRSLLLYTIYTILYHLRGPEILYDGALYHRDFPIEEIGKGKKNGGNSESDHT